MHSTHTSAPTCGEPGGEEARACTPPRCVASSPWLAGNNIMFRPTGPQAPTQRGGCVGYAIVHKPQKRWAPGGVVILNRRLCDFRTRGTEKKKLRTSSGLRYAEVRPLGCCSFRHRVSDVSDVLARSLTLMRTRVTRVLSSRVLQSVAPLSVPLGVLGVQSVICARCVRKYLTLEDTRKRSSQPVAGTTRTMFGADLWSAMRHGRRHGARRRFVAGA